MGIDYTNNVNAPTKKKSSKRLVQQKIHVVSINI